MNTATNTTPVRDLWGEQEFNERQAALRRWVKAQGVDKARLLAVDRALRHHGWHAADSRPDRTAYNSPPAREARDAVLEGLLSRECFNGWPGDDGARTATGEQVYACLTLLQEAGAPTEILTPFVEAFGVFSVGPVSAPASDDVLAESGDVDNAELERLNIQVRAGNFAVPDSYATAKTRGSAQRLFANLVKPNYGWKCALTGIATRDFLVASHIVPWSEDESIRLDPANGICLSTLVDRAFDTGYLVVHEDYRVHVNWNCVGTDEALRAVLGPYDGQKLSLPAAFPPNPEFLRRRLGES